MGKRCLILSIEECGFRIYIASGYTKKMGIGSLRVYVSGQNLLTFSKFFDGYDPEVSYSGSQGGESYPIMQTFTFGLDLKF